MSQQLRLKPRGLQLNSGAKPRPGPRGAPYSAPASSVRPQRASAAVASVAIAAGAASASAAENRAVFSARMPKTMQRVAPKRKAVTMAAPLATSDDSSDGDDEEAGDDAGTRRASSPEPEPSQQPERKRQRTAAPAAAASASAPAATVVCLACNSPFSSDAIVDHFFCPVCDLIFTATDGSAANQRRLSKLAAAVGPAAGAHSSTHSSQLDTSSSNSSKPKLGAYEAELRRLLEVAGDPLPRFQSADPISHGDAISGLRDNSFAGITFAHQSAWLTKLIRSGHFKELSLALPFTNLDALRRRTAEAKGSRVMLSASGELTSTAETQVERQLANLQEFLKILVVSILPSLFDRPRAALDWLELARSVIDVSELDGWSVASRYMSDLLNDRVPTAAAFNKFDHTILQAVRATAAAAAPGLGDHAPGATPAPARAPGGSPAGDRPAYLDACAPGTCRDWSLATCTAAGTCRYKHICCWAACPSPSDGHKGRDCPKKPAGVGAPRAGAPGSGGKRRGAGKPAAGADGRK